MQWVGADGVFLPGVIDGLLLRFVFLLFLVLTFISVFLLSYDMFFLCNVSASI